MKLGESLFTETPKDQLTYKQCNTNSKVMLPLKLFTVCHTRMLPCHPLNSSLTHWKPPALPCHNCYIITFIAVLGASSYHFVWLLTLCTNGRCTSFLYMGFKVDFWILKWHLSLFPLLFLWFYNDVKVYHCQLFILQVGNISKVQNQNSFYCPYARKQAKQNKKISTQINK